MPRNGWYLSAAAVAFSCGIIGVTELYYSGDLAGDWHGPAWVLTGIAWLYVAYRRPGDDQPPN